MADCKHLDQIQVVELPEPISGCEECLKVGAPWNHLRMCMTCGKIGCCDDSSGKHARRHALVDGHPIMRSAQPGEDWCFCFTDYATFDVPTG